MKFVAILIAFGASIGLAIAGPIKESPPLTILKAVQIAQQTMKDDGLTEKYFIESVRLIHPKGGEPYYFALFGEELRIKEAEDGTKENVIFSIGVRIEMDGKAKVTVEEPLRRRVVLPPAEKPLGRRVLPPAKKQ